MENYDDTLNPKNILNNVQIFSNIARFIGIDKCESYAQVNTKTLDAYKNYCKQAWDVFLKNTHVKFLQFREKNLRCSFRQKRYTIEEKYDIDADVKFLLKLNYIAAKRFMSTYPEQFTGGYGVFSLIYDKFVELLNEINHNFYRYQNEKYRFEKQVRLTSKSTHNFNIDFPIFHKYLESVDNMMHSFNDNTCLLNNIIYELKTYFGIFDHLIDDVEPTFIKNIYNKRNFLYVKGVSKFVNLDQIINRPGLFFARNPDKMESFVKKCLTHNKTAKQLNCFLKQMTHDCVLDCCGNCYKYCSVNPDSIDKLKELNTDEKFKTRLDDLKKTQNFGINHREQPYTLKTIDEKKIDDMKNIINSFFVEFPGSFLTGSAALCFYNLENNIHNLFNPNNIDIIMTNKTMYDKCTNKYTKATVNIDVDNDCKGMSCNIDAYTDYKGYKFHVFDCSKNIQDLLCRFTFDFCCLLWDGTFEKSSERALNTAKNRKTTFSITDYQSQFKDDELYIAKKLWKYSCRGYEIDLQE